MTQESDMGLCGPSEERARTIQRALELRDLLDSHSDRWRAAVAKLNAPSSLVGAQAFVLLHHSRRDVELALELLDNWLFQLNGGA